jgi:hypothetical protein
MTWRRDTRSPATTVKTPTRSIAWWKFRQHRPAQDNNGDNNGRFGTDGTVNRLLTYAVDVPPRCSAQRMGGMNEAERTKMQLALMALRELLDDNDRYDWDKELLASYVALRRSFVTMRKLKRRRDRAAVAGYLRECGWSDADAISVTPPPAR